MSTKIIKYIDLVYKFNDDDDSACNLINIINKEYKNKCNIFFGNGGDRTNKTTPEVEFCTKNNIEMIIDSISVIEIISFVEKEYNITFKQSELSIKNLNTVNQIETFIKKKLK